MNKHPIIIGALVLLIGAFAINVFVRSSSSKTVPAVTVASGKVDTPKETTPEVKLASAEGGRATKPISKSLERAEIVQRNNGRDVEGFASLSKEERLRQITAGVDLTYKKIIAGLGISQAEQEKLRTLLIERSLARWDAHDIATANAAPEQDSLNRALTLADALSDEEITKAFSPTVLEKIHSMIAARPYIARINQHYDPAMAQAGVPLMPEQVLPLAEIFYHTFGSANNPQVEANRQQVDPVTGLTPLDLIALDRAKTVLTQAQLEIVRQKIATLNRAYYLGKS